MPRASRNFFRNGVASGFIVGILLISSLGIVAAQARNVVPASSALPIPKSVSSPSQIGSPVPAAPRPASGGTNPSWTKVCTGASPFTCSGLPGVRRGSAMIWDAADGYALLTGGGSTLTTGLVNQSFEWKHGIWTALGAGPSTFVARANASIAYDTVDGYVVMFGGYTGSGAVSSQTWKFLAGTWSLLTEGTAPNARDGASMTYIPASGGHGGYILYYGGHNLGSYRADTWEFVGGSWTNITASAGTAPVARAYASMAYDATDSYALLEGGIAADGTSILNGTYDFSPVSSTWTQLIANGGSGGPSKVFESNMVYVTALTTTYLVCGAIGTLVTPSAPNGGCSVWGWTGGSTNKWFNVSGVVGFGNAGTIAPKAGYDGAMTDIPGYSYAYRFGGVAVASTANNTFALGNLLSFTVQANTAELPVLSSLSLYANTTFGAPPYSFAWSTLPTGCSTANVSVLTCAPSTSGGYNVTVKVTGTDGFNLSSAVFVYVDPSGTVSGTIVQGPELGVNNNATFLGTSEDLPNNNNASFMGFLNQTTIKVIRSGASCDDSDYTDNLQYSKAGVPSTLQFSWSGTATQMAVSKTIWIACINGEINNAAAGAQNLSYVENTLHVHPTYWSIGNEPNNWHYFNIPLASRGASPASGHSTPTAAEYALLVWNYTAALKAVDPNIKIVGIQAGLAQAGAGPWFAALAAKDGPNLTAVSVHSYTQSGNGQGYQSRASFLSPTTMNNYGLNILHSEQNYSANCYGGSPVCAKTPVFTGEFNSYASGSINPWQVTYPEVPFIGSGVVQALQQNCTSIQFFRFYTSGNLSLINQTTNTPYPSFYLYSGILNHLSVGGGTYWDNVSASGMNGIYSVETQPNGVRDLLIVNANTSVSLSLSFAGLSFGNYPTTYSDTSPGLVSVVTYSGGIPSTLTILPGEVLLIDGASVPSQVRGTPPLGIGPIVVSNGVVLSPAFLLGGALFVGGIAGVVATRTTTGLAWRLLTVVALVAGLLTLAIFWP